MPLSVKKTLRVAFLTPNTSLGEKLVVKIED